MGITQSLFSACWDSSWVLDTCVLLVLVIWVAMAIQHSFSRRSRKALRVSRLRRRGTEGEGEGAKKQWGKQPRDRLGWDPPSPARRAPGRRSIRQLLGDNADCALCNAAARQAERPLYTNRAGAYRLDFHLVQNALGSFILPPCVIHSQAISTDQEHRREMNIRLQRRRGRKSQLGERATEVTSGTVGASNLECRGHLCALQERMQARWRKLSPSLNSAASEEESRLLALDES